ncbi:hypothetical protein IGI72_003783 [Enterococcus sp. DIV1059_2]|nr:hypothetical protein A5882_003448 [Enterococcus sp. 4E1_DIV0656]
MIMATKIRVKNLKFSNKNTKLWYYDFQGKEFDLFMDTKAGYLVNRPDVNKSKWNIKHNHSDLIQEDDDIV